MSAVLFGSQTPRIWTPPIPGLPTMGPAAVAVGELAGMGSFPWQETVHETALQFDPSTQRWVRRGVCLVVARQNGKTRILAVRILAGLYAFETDRLILHTAQDRAVPRELFEQMVEAIESSPPLHKLIARRGIREANGQERITLKDGSTYRILAPKAARFRTWSADVLIFDEGREQRDTTLWGAAIPTQRARPNPQWIVASNAGDPDSVVLNDIVEKGRNAAEEPLERNEVGYLEWSAHEKRKLTDRKGWVEANPSLGYLIDASDIESELGMLDEEAFRTEILCQWVDTAGRAAIPPASWAECLEPQPIPELPAEDRKEATWLAIDVDPEHTHAELLIARWVRGAQGDTDRLVVAVLERWIDEEGINERAIAEEVAAWRRHFRARALAYDPWTSQGIADQFNNTRTKTIPITGQKYVTACNALLDAAVNGVLWHAGDAELTKQVHSAVRRDAADGTWRIARAHSAIPIPGVLALARVVWLAYQPRRRKA